MAITLVFIFHYLQYGHPEWIEPVGRFGWTGVDLFFVLSGFLIARQLLEALAKHQPKLLQTFFIKRFFRIIPAYVIIVSLYAVCPPLREREGLAPLWRYLTFTLNFGLDLRTTGTFTHSWSLCIEEQFYLVLPVVILLLHNAKPDRSLFGDRIRLFGCRGCKSALCFT